MTVLVTGSSGFMGKQISKALTSKGVEVVGIDIRDSGLKSDLFHFHKFDIRDQKIEEIFTKYSISEVIHLACIVTPSKTMTREFMYEVDVVGTDNILNLVKKYKVKTLSVASSGAAYGYHHDSPEWLKESDPVRGNEEFPYSFHKGIVEEKLKTFREENREIRLFVFRIGTILGESVNNQITDLFKKPFLIGIKGSDSPFVFIWDKDLVNIFLASLTPETKPGIYNVAGTGKLTILDLGIELQKKVLFIPAFCLSLILFILKRLKLTQYGEEQVNFLRYRPVLLNEKLINEFPYKPEFTSLQAFRKYLKKS